MLDPDDATEGAIQYGLSLLTDRSVPADLGRVIDGWPELSPEAAAIVNIATRGLS